MRLPCLPFALACGLWLLWGCAEGYDPPRGFDAGVRNTRLENPHPDSITFTVNAAGDEATIKWPLVRGAGGYIVSFRNVDDPAAPTAVGGYDNKLVDGLSITVPVAEDSKYSFDLQAAGDAALGNTDATGTAHKEVSTLVPSFVTIPDGEDISAWLKAYTATRPFPACDPDNPRYDETAIELQPGGQYTMSEAVDFRTQKVTFRGDKLRWATIRMLGKAAFCTCSGLKMKYLKIDCAESAAGGLICMSQSTGDNPLPDSIKVQNMGYTGSKLGKDFFIVQDPIYISECWIKDLPAALAYDNDTGCAWWYLTISNCIIQQNNTSGKPFINFEKKGIAIKHLTLTNSTLYNITDAGSYWLRFSNKTANQTVRVWGEKDATYKTSTTDVVNCTFSKQFARGKMANNNHGNNNILTFARNIFYDCAMVRKWACADTGSPIKHYSLNFWKAVTSPDEADPTQTDRDGNQFALKLEGSGMFEGSVTQSLDLTQPNGGVNFAPADMTVKQNRAGDPRWLGD